MAEVTPDGVAAGTAGGAGGVAGSLAPSGRAWDPRAIRVTLAPGAAPGDVRAIVVEPPETAAVAASGPAGPARTATASGTPAIAFVAPDASLPRIVLLDGRPVEAGLRLLGGERAMLTLGGPAGTEHRVLFPAGRATAGSGEGRARREVVVDGWRFEVDVEPAARAALRERATRGRAAATHSGPTEVRAIIPGVVAAVSVAVGDTVAAGQQLLVIEAMKMQNELRAPRSGTVDRVDVASGARIDVGDLLVVIN